MFHVMNQESASMGQYDEFVDACDEAIGLHEEENMEFIVTDKNGKPYWSTTLLYEADNVVYLDVRQVRIAARA